MIPGLQVDHSPGHLRGVLYSVQGGSIQDVDASPSVDEDLGHPAIPNVHGDNHSVVVREEDSVGVCVGEGDRPTQGRG